LSHGLRGASVAKTDCPLRVIFARMWGSKRHSPFVASPWWPGGPADGAVMLKRAAVRIRSNRERGDGVDGRPNFRTDGRDIYVWIVGPTPSLRTSGCRQIGRIPCREKVDRPDERRPRPRNPRFSGLSRGMTVSGGFGDTTSRGAGLVNDATERDLEKILRS
jgi:hypothetical protein